MLFGATQQNQLQPRLLPERSYLYFKYPQPNTEYSVEFYLPILENPEISETQSPNLGVYNLLGRAGNLFSYHGANSRQFTLRFYITLPHVAEYIVNYGMHEQFTDSFRFFSNAKEEEKKRFLRYNNFRSRLSKEGATDIALGEDTSSKWLYTRKSEGRYNDLLPQKSELQQLLDEFNNISSSAFKLPILENLGDILNIFSKPKNNKVLFDSINYTMLMINVIRTSTLNNAKNTSLGPPTIYLNHGNMYNNIPCICTNYNIRLVTETGYHISTLTPRRIEINMNLSENRTGDFTAFQPFTFIKGENLAGWEAIMEERTLDPWGSTFGDYDSDTSKQEAWEKSYEEGLAAAAEQRLFGATQEELLLQNNEQLDLRG
jgi:hypothetical protein